MKVAKFPLGLVHQKDKVTPKRLAQHGPKYLRFIVYIGIIYVAK